MDTRRRAVVWACPPAPTEAAGAPVGRREGGGDLGRHALSSGLRPLLADPLQEGRTYAALVRDSDDGGAL